MSSTSTGAGFRPGQFQRERSCLHRKLVEPRRGLRDGGAELASALKRRVGENREGGGEPHPATICALWLAAGHRDKRRKHGPPLSPIFNRAGPAAVFTALTSSSWNCSGFSRSDCQLVPAAGTSRTSSGQQLMPANGKQLMPAAGNS